MIYSDNVIQSIPVLFPFQPYQLQKNFIETLT